MIFYHIFTADLEQCICLYHDLIYNGATF